MAGMVKNDLSLDEKELEIKVIVKNIGDTLDKMEKYLGEDIEKLEVPAKNLDPMKFSLNLSLPQIYERFIKSLISWVKQKIQNIYRKLVRIWQHKD